MKKSAEQLLIEIAIRTGKTVVCSGGVHVEDICDRQILEVREAVERDDAGACCAIVGNRNRIMNIKYRKVISRKVTQKNNIEE